MQSYGSYKRSINKYETVTKLQKTSLILIQHRPTRNGGLLRLLGIYHYGLFGYNHGYPHGRVVLVKIFSLDPRTLWGTTLLLKKTRGFIYHLPICQLLFTIYHLLFTIYPLSYTIYLWVAFGRPPRCQNKHRGGLPLSVSRCCFFEGGGHPLGVWSGYRCYFSLQWFQYIYIYIYIYTILAFI